MKKIAENKAQAEKAEEKTQAEKKAEKAQAEKKAQALAEAQAFLYKQKQKKKAQAVKKLADATELIEWLCFNDKKVLKNKTLTIRNRTIKSIRALDENADIANTYSYNKNAIEYTQAVKALQALGYYIFTEEKKA